MTNYICINGKKTELTDEQLRQLGIEIPKKNPFERADKGDSYYCIGTDGEVFSVRYTNDRSDNAKHKVANYCTDKAILEQRALHETLNRLLWRYSMEHDGDKIGWGNDLCAKYFIVLDRKAKYFYADCLWSHYIFGVPYFFSASIAQDAIKEIVKPFMEAHPEFVW